MGSQLLHVKVIDDDFCCMGESAINSKYSFGSVRVLGSTILNKILSYCASDEDARVISVRVTYGDSSLIIFGCYLPRIYDNIVSNVTRIVYIPSVDGRSTDAHIVDDFMQKFRYVTLASTVVTVFVTVFSCQ